MKLTERIFIFVMMFGVIIQGLIVMQGLNYLRSDFSKFMINVSRGFIAMGFTYVTLISCILISRKFYEIREKRQEIKRFKYCVSV